MESSVGFLLESCRKVDKRKLDFLFAVYLLVVLDHFSFCHTNCNTKLINNGRRQPSGSPGTMAMGSLQPPSRN
jgi:hypothetical protein